jgi:hypothetical protein
MSTVVKDLGAVSAYAYAVEKGYTGTEAEFAELMADYAEVGQRAEDAAESALNSKTAAQTAATTATNKASEATTAAQTATTKAGEAQTSAHTASSKASEASQSASTASQKATESAQSASQALSYKTDAESAKTASQTAQGLAESARDSAISAKDDAESARDEAQNIVNGISAKAEQIDANTASIANLTKDKAPVITDTASGAIASFADGADGLPLKNLIVNIDPVQDLSNGDPSPENICPISGWTGMEIQQTGYNVWDEEWEVGGYAGSTGAAWDTNTRIRSKTTNYISVLPNTTYYVKMPSGTNMYLDIMFYNADKTFISRTNPNAGTTFTTPSDAQFMRFASSAAYGTTYNHDISINYPSTDHDYHPYVGQTIPISWQTEAGTVYGGKLDVLGGKLTVYPYYASYNGETLTGEWISDRDVYAVGTTPTIGAQVVNIGAEGTEYQLEPHEVASLLGQNNIFADTGDVSVEYRADTKLYIERLTAPDSADMIADANITSGQYFMVGNSLYKATANIANGGQITVGTNCTRVSLAQALNEINA